MSAVAPGGSADSVVGPFRVLAPLSKGGMACVDLARPLDGGPICVLKQLHGSLEADDDAARRFAREAQLAALLEHPNIARLVGSGRAEGRLFIATELVRGVTFEQLNRGLWAQRRPLSAPLALGPVLPVLRALEYAHALRDEEGRPVGIVHRDLSSKNVMVNTQGRVKIIDFGVAKGAVDDHRTATGMLMGTPLYMSPEQAAGRRVDHRSDLYTVGVVLWELLAGRRLVTAKGQAQMLMAVSKERAPDLSTVRPEIPRPLSEVVRRALEKIPSARFEDARAFRAALSEASDGVGLADEAAVAAFVGALMRDRFEALDRLLASVDRTPPAAASTGEPERSDPTAAPARARSPLRLGAGLVAIAAAGLLVATGWWAREGAPSPRPVEPTRPSALPALPAPPAPSARAEPPDRSTPSRASEALDPNLLDDVTARPSDPARPPRRTPRPGSGSTGLDRNPSEEGRPPALGADAEPTRPERPPATASPRAQLQPLLDRYRRTGSTGAATKLYGRLRGYARGPAAPGVRSCIEAVLGALDFLKYDDVASTAPLFDEAIDCMRHRDGP